MQQNEGNFEFYPYKGFNLIKEACDILDKNNYGENLITKNNLTRKKLLIDNLRIYFKKILFAIQNLDIDINLNNNININKNNLGINNSNNNKEALIPTEDKEDEINTDNTNINIINTKIEFNNDLIGDDCENTKIKENKFYQKFNNISGNFKIFKTSVGHIKPLENYEEEQLHLLLVKSGMI